MTTLAPAAHRAPAIPRPMPEEAPVTMAVCPLRIGRASHAGITTSGNCSGIRSRIVELLILVIVVIAAPFAGPRLVRGVTPHLRCTAWRTVSPRAWMLRDRLVAGRSEYNRPTLPD